jgi:hypothetical protein
VAQPRRGRRALPLRGPALRPAHGLRRQARGIRGSRLRVPRLLLRGRLRAPHRDRAAETSRVTLRVAGGFPDEPEARAELERYAKGIGVDIDWSRPAESSERGGERADTFWDREPGHNAGADLIYRGAKLVGIGLHLAL